LTQNRELNAYLRAYYASVTFADAQLGRVLDLLEARDLRRNTYVVVVSDNGFMLGEKRDFTKFELRDVALRVPLFISGPGIAARVVRTPVGLVDLYPTLCGLAGIPVPAHCDGEDLSPALLAGREPVRPPVPSYYGGLSRKQLRLRLHASIRTAEWRLTNYGGPRMRPPTPLTLREENELYDHGPGRQARDRTSGSMWRRLTPKSSRCCDPCFRTPRVSISSFRRGW
jgi:arylsulfatase A-like enzyme